MMPYEIVCWNPVESDQPEIYPTRKEALRDLENYAVMQPEYIFRIVRMPPGEYRDRTGGKPSKGVRSEGDHGRQAGGYLYNQADADMGLPSSE